MKVATTRPTRRRARLLAAGVAVAALLTACAGSDDTAESTTAAPTDETTEATTAPSPTEPASPTPTTPATETAAEQSDGPVTVTDSMGTEVTLQAPAEAIVSLSPTGTESLFAIGAGDQVVAVDEFSYYPEEAPVTDLSGFEPNVEAVASYEPDLVVLSGPGEIVGELDALGIPSVVQTAATSFDDVYGQITNLGVLTGQVDGATVLVEQMQTELDKLVDDAPIPDEPLTYYHEISSDFYTASSTSFIGQVYGLFGLVNIADEAAEEAGTEFPQLSPETIIEADPDLVYLATGAAGESTETVADRPGWGEMTAVHEGNVIVLPADIPSRWGPRIVEFAQVIAESLEPFA